MEETWFDRAGNFHSDALKVTERYSLIDANTTFRVRGCAGGDGRFSCGRA